MKLQPPLQGVSDIAPDSHKAGATSRDMLNCRGIDPRTKKIRFSSREGLTKYLDTQVRGTAHPVRAIRSNTHQRKNLIYTDKVSSATVTLGDSTDATTGLVADVSHQARTSSALPVKNADTDKQGNLYSVDGLAAIEKRNSKLELQWTQSLPD